MPRKTTPILLAVLLILVILAIVGLRRGSAPSPAVLPGPRATATPRPGPSRMPAATLPPSTLAPATARPRLPKTPPPKVIKKAGTEVTSTGAPIPPKLELHRELIPKDITIVRCYYSQDGHNMDITQPGTSIEFDLNGSGFTSEFEKMIAVDSGHPKIKVKNLRLVTANQIHGTMEVGADAATSFVYPRVLIKNLPVFTAPDPFAVVRKGEVLTIIFISMEDSGRAGRFRVITNLDETMAGQFRIEPSTAGLDIAHLEGHLPYAVEGTLRIGARVPPGSYGMILKLGEREIYRRDGMIRIVRPNVGQTGFVQGVMAAERYHRPGETIQLYLQGTGLAADDANQLAGQVTGYDMGLASFTFISGSQMRVSFNSPAAAPPGTYGVEITGALTHEKLFEKADVFELVGPNWIGGVQVSPPVHQGGKSVLKVLGKDLSPELTAQLTIATDEPGLHIGALSRRDAGTITGDISTDPGVAPGDYWLHLSAGGKKINPPYGSLIKVEPR